MLANGLLKKAEPTAGDTIAARMIGKGHPYWSEVIDKSNCHGNANGATDVTGESREYRRLLEILACRERQLEIAVSLLSEREREVVGA